MRPAELLRYGVRVFSHVFIDRSYQKYYSAGEWERKYSKDGYNLDGLQEDGRYGALVTLLRRYDRGGPILDAGCGDGLLELRYRPWSESLMVGIDYSETAIQTACDRKLPGTEFHAASFADYRGGPFSVIVFNETLYYSENYMEILRGMEPMLTPDGVFLVSMFDTLVTARIWRTLRRSYRPLQTVFIKDGASGRKWTISVFPRP